MKYQTLNNYCTGKPLIIHKDYLSLVPGYTLKFLNLLDILGIFLTISIFIKQIQGYFINLYESKRKL